MKKLFDLQMFADENAAAGSEAGTAEKVDSAAADNGKEKDTAKEAPKYTDKDLDEIINKKFAKWQQQQQKAVDEAVKLEKMNAQQKAEYERDKLQKELDEYKRKDSLAGMTKTARKMLSDSGITVSDDLLALMVTTDATETKKAIDGFTKAFTEAVEAAVKERLKGEPPRKGSAGGVGSMTKEQIMAIKDPELRQKKMLENKHLFNF